MKSPILDYVMRNGESVQSPLVKMLAGFTFYQEMSTYNKLCLDSNKEGIDNMAFELLLNGLWTLFCCNST